MYGTAVCLDVCHCAALGGLMFSYMTNKEK